MKSLIALVLVLSAAACGGGPSGPGPLRHTLDNQFIVAVPPSEQGAVIAAEQEVVVATKERDKAEYDLKGVDLDVRIASWEYDRAKLSMKIAEARRELAATRGITAQNDADVQVRAASLGLQAAEAKRDFVKAKRDWLKKWARYTVYNFYAAESKLHLEKARLAKAKNNYPKGFDLAKYEEQHRDRSSKAKEAKDRADGDFRRAQEHQRTWAQREQQYKAAAGVAGPSEAQAAADDMAAPKPAPAPTRPNVAPTPSVGGTEPAPSSEFKDPTAAPPASP